MKFFDKDKYKKNGGKKAILYFCGIPIWFEEKNPIKRILKIFGIPVLYYKYNSLSKNGERLFDDINAFVHYVQSKVTNNSNKNILWADHLLGGGTEVYSISQISKLKDTHTVFRLQYNPFWDYYLLIVPNIAIAYVPNVNELKKSLQYIIFSEICINNLVSWADISEMLAFIQEYKTKNENVKISMRGHDFHSICPSYNLLNCENEFCSLSYKNGCENCIKNVRLSDDEPANKILFYGFKTIPEWRKMWSDFYKKVDEMILFSNSTKEIFLQAYPFLAQKIKIIPHEVKKLPKVSIKEHDGINIAMLGNMKSIAKGQTVIEEMCKNNFDAAIKLFVIGPYNNPPQHLIVTGKYASDDLPCLVEKHQIDIVFISSIWPETFSYTTSEAMNMGIPVVCYDMGAPAERVKTYQKGLVLKNIDPAMNLIEIKNFVEKLRKEQN